MDDMIVCTYCGNSYEACEATCPICGTPNNEQ